MRLSTACASLDGMLPRRKDNFRMRRVSPEAGSSYRVRRRKKNQGQGTDGSCLSPGGGGRNARCYPAAELDPGLKNAAIVLRIKGSHTYYICMHVVYIYVICICGGKTEIIVWKKYARQGKRSADNVFVFPDLQYLPLQFYLAMCKHLSLSFLSVSFASCPISPIFFVPSFGTFSLSICLFS